MRGFAADMGWWNASRGPFDFTDVFTDPKPVPVVPLYGRAVTRGGGVVCQAPCFFSGPTPWDDIHVLAAFALSALFVLPSR